MTRSAPATLRLRRSGTCSTPTSRSALDTIEAMGLFRNRRERESALSDQLQSGQPDVPVTPQGGHHWANALGAMAMGGAAASQWQQTFNVQDAEGLREDMMAVLKQHGIEPGMGMAV